MGFTQIDFEPAGNCTPDFLLDDRIAVEVRRLNENHEDGAGMHGLEEAYIPLWHAISALLKRMGSASDESWFVSFTLLSRPVEPLRTLGPKIKDALSEFKDRPIRTNQVIFASEGLSVDVAKASSVHADYFLWGCGQDMQSGGAIVTEAIRNIEICSAEKLAKIAEHRSRYPEWWLVLVNNIGLGLGDYDKQQLIEHFNRPKGWDKLVIAYSPNDWLEF